MSLAKLPNEVLLNIIEFGYDSTITPVNFGNNYRIFTLPLAKCSKQFYELCTPILYSTVYISGQRTLKIFIKTIADNVKLGSYVRRVDLQSFDSISDYLAPIISDDVLALDLMAYRKCRDLVENDNRLSFLASQATRDFSFWPATALLLCLVPNIEGLWLPPFISKKSSRDSANTLLFCRFIKRITQFQRSPRAQRAPLSQLKTICFAYISNWHDKPFLEKIDMNMNNLLPFLSLKSLTTLHAYNVCSTPENEVGLFIPYLPTLELALHRVNIAEPALISLLSRFKSLESLTVTYQPKDRLHPRDSQQISPRDVVQGASHMRKSLKYLNTDFPYAGVTPVVDGLVAWNALTELTIALLSLLKTTIAQLDTELVCEIPLADKLPKTLEILTLDMPAIAYSSDPTESSLDNKLLRFVHELVDMDNRPAKLSEINVRGLLNCKCPSHLCQLDCGILEQHPILQKIITTCEHKKIKFKCFDFRTFGQNSNSDGTGQ